MPDEEIEGLHIGTAVTGGAPERLAKARKRVRVPVAYPPQVGELLLAETSPLHTELPLADHEIPVVRRTAGERSEHDMNSRGKPLTAFEHFKVELERTLKSAEAVDRGQTGAAVDIAQRTRKFTLRKTILLYALTTYLRFGTVPADQFARRLRIVWNLVQNSDDQISDSESRSGGNRMPEILGQVKTVVLTGKVPLPNADGTGNGFNPYQLEEEARKAVWTIHHPDLAEQLYALEDHGLLEGQMGIVGLDHPDLFDRFASLFSCDRGLIDCALLSLGDYTQQSKRAPQRRQIGSSGPDSAWKNLFHRSRDSDGFENTSDVLVELLGREKEFSDEKLKAIIGAFLAKGEDDCRFDWRYYYVNPKYRQFFRLGRYGKLWCDGDHDKEQYLMRVMFTEARVSENSTQPYLMAASDGIEGWKSEREGADYGYGKPMVNDILGQRICCDNDSFVLRDAASGQELRRLKIEQHDGIDCENRIEKLRSDLLGTNGHVV